MTITIQMINKRKQRGEEPTEPTEEPRKEMKVASSEAVREEEKDLSDPANNWLIRKYQVASEEEHKTLMQQTMNDMTTERMREEIRKGGKMVRLDIRVDLKKIGTLKIPSDGLITIRTACADTKWHPFDELDGYAFCLSDEDADTGLRPTPTFEKVPTKPPKGKDGPESIRNFEKWLVEVDRHQLLSTESATFKFDQIPIAKFHKIPDLLRGLYKYMDKHPEMILI